ncbi:O-antigen ligase family protein [Patescibacteria group bacterium]
MILNEQKLISFRLLWWLLPIGLTIYLVSFLAYLYPNFNDVAFWVITIVFAVLSYKKMEYGLMIIVAELILGSKGYLLSQSVFDYVISLRLSFFIVIFIIWTIKRISDKQWRFWKTSLKWPFILFTVFLSYGLVNGLLNSSAKTAFFDLNGYLFFGLLIIGFDIIRNQKSILNLIKVIISSSLILGLFTFILFINFSFINYNDGLVVATQVNEEQLAKLGQTPETAPLGQTLDQDQELLKVRYDELTSDKNISYRWLRDTGLAEISYLGGKFFRVFFYSHLYLMISFVLFLMIVLNNWDKMIAKYKFVNTIYLLFITFTVLISFSRSILLGVIIAVLVSLFYISKRRRWQLVVTILLLLVVSSLIIKVVAPETYEVITDRLLSFYNPQTETAAVTRVSLLGEVWNKFMENPVMGSGFGASVVLPNIIPGSDDVYFTSVYLYEWTYLDIAVKIGLLGLLALIWLIIGIIKQVNKLREFIEYKIIYLWFTITLISFIVINITTPYINHPLGIGWLIIVYLVSWNLVKLKNVES